MGQHRPPAPPTAPTLLLVGGGHAHVEILRRLALEDPPPVRPVLVSSFRDQHYSGMTPGYVAGLYREEELTLDLAALARRAGVELVVGTVRQVDPGGRRVTLAAGREVPYDLASFAIGSRAAGEEIPGVREHAQSIKPLAKAVEVRRRLVELARPRSPEPSPGGRSSTVVVVGGGAAGVEIALAAVQVLKPGGMAGGDQAAVTLLEAGDEILSGYARRFRRRAARVLRRKGIAVALRTRVAAVEAEAVLLAGAGAAVAGEPVESHPAGRFGAEDGDGRDGEEPRPLRRVPADLVLWLTGPAAPPLFAGSGLPLDDRGFLLVDPSLRVPGRPELFAAGDCATLREHPWTPKAGVYAVHQAPVLWRSLVAALQGLDPLAEGVRYEPQEGFLSLLNVGDGTALLSWKGIAAHGRWVGWLKDRIDRRFVRRYRRLEAPISR